MKRGYLFILVLFSSLLFSSASLARLIEFDIRGTEYRVDEFYDPLPNRSITGSIYYDIEMTQMVAGVLQMGSDTFVYDRSRGIGGSSLVGGVYDAWMFIDFDISFVSLSNPENRVHWSRNQYEIWGVYDAIPCFEDDSLPCYWGVGIGDEEVWAAAIANGSSLDAFPVYQASYYSNGVTGDMWAAPPGEGGFRFVDEVPSVVVPATPSLLLAMFTMVGLIGIRKYH